MVRDDDVGIDYACDIHPSNIHEYFSLGFRLHQYCSYAICIPSSTGQVFANTDTNFLETEIILVRFRIK